MQWSASAAAVVAPTFPCRQQCRRSEVGAARLEWGGAPLRCTLDRRDTQFLALGEHHVVVKGGANARQESFAGRVAVAAGCAAPEAVKLRARLPLPCVAA